VDVAVLEAGGRDLLRDGLGCDRCDVALVTDAPDPATAEDCAAEELTEACGALLRALGPQGKAVLNADAPPPDHLLPPPERVIWFSQDARHPRLREHRALGGTAVFLDEDTVVLARGPEEKRLVLGVRLAALEPAERLGFLAARAADLALHPALDDTPVSPSSVPARERTLSAV
jgi:cyanophycin synthetase